MWCHFTKYRHSPTYTVPSYAISDLHNFIRGKKNGSNRIFSCVLNVCIQKWKYSDTKMAE